MATPALIALASQEIAIPHLSCKLTSQLLSVTPPTPQAVKLFGELWPTVRDECELEALAVGIAGLEYSGIKHKVRRAELHHYLQSIHIRALMTIQSVLVTRGVMTENQRSPLNSSGETLLTRNGYFDLVKQVPEIATSSSELWFSAVENLFHGLRLRHRFAPQEVARRNWKFLILDFPSVYVDQLRRLLWPDWYTACFVKDCYNSSLSGNYGDAHRGACLIFEADEEGGQAHLKLKRGNGGSSSRDGTYRTPLRTPLQHPSPRYAAGPRKPLAKAFQGHTISAYPTPQSTEEMSVAAVRGGKKVPLCFWDNGF